MINLLFDTDMGYDDALALAYLSAVDNVEIGLVIISPGLARPVAGWHNARKMLDCLGLGHVKVAIGCQEPLMPGGSEFPSAWRDMADSIGELIDPKICNYSIQMLSQIKLDMFRESKSLSTFLCCGGLTSLATEYGKLIPHNKIVIMGGVLYDSGNLHYHESDMNSSTAEWNFHIDPMAAKMVIRQLPEITLVTLDITKKVPITNSFLERLSKYKLNKAGSLALKILKHPSVQRGIGQYSYFWDVLASAISIKSISFKSQLTEIDIVTENREAKERNVDLGTIYVKNGGFPVKIVNDIDSRSLEDSLFTSWCRNY